MDRIVVTPVNENESSWEDFSPRFRVYIHDSSEGSTEGATDTIDITGADVAQVISWAQQQVHGDQTYAVALVVGNTPHGNLNAGHSRGLVWLLGVDGNTPTDLAPNCASWQRRMLHRRADPIILPVADEAGPDCLS